MKRTFLRSLAVAAAGAAVFAFASPAAAATFLELDGVKGPASNGYIELISSEWSVDMPLSSGSTAVGRTHGRAQFRDVTVTKRPDFTTPSLALKCAGGDDIKYAKLHFVDGGVEWQTVTLNSVIITSFAQTQGAARTDGTEKISLNFREIVWESGKVRSGFSLEKNTKAQLDVPTSSEPSPVQPPVPVPQESQPRQQLALVIEKPAPTVRPQKAPTPAKVASR